MSETPETSEAPVLQKKQFFILLFLKETDPAKLLIWSAIVFILAMLCSVVSMKLQTGFDWGYALNEGMSMRDGTYSLDVSGGAGRQGRLWTSSFFKILAYLFTIIGGLLPIWTIGRLISDAVKSNGRLIADAIENGAKS